MVFMVGMVGIGSQGLSPDRRIAKIEFGNRVKWEIPVRSVLTVDPMISAEVVPNAGKATLAARELQRLGFRIVLIDDTISVQGRQSLWTSTFAIQFERKRRPLLSGILNDIETFQKAIKNTLNIPEQLQNLVNDVMFIEPPELF